jgi:hypothetical protein
MAVIRHHGDPFPRHWSTSLRVVASVLTALIIANLLFLGVVLVWPDGVSRLTAGVIPPHYVSDFDADPLDNYNGTHGIAHNSGDSVDKIIRAVGAGAHGIEIDVILYRGDLYARHNLPVTVFGEFGFRPVTLAEAWEAAETELVQLDLKSTTPTFLARVVSFLEAHENDQRIVLVSSWDPQVLAYFQEHVPWVGRLLSIGSVEDYESFVGGLARYESTGLLNGVTIQHELLERSVVTLLQEHGLLTFAWTVEHLSRVNELTMLGVDAIVTDDLAILSLIRNRREVEFIATPIADLADVVEGTPLVELEPTAGGEQVLELTPPAAGDQADEES